MSSYQKERELFLVRFVADVTTACPGVTVEEARRAATLLMRHATTHGNLAVQMCNGHPAQESNLPAAVINEMQDAWDARIAKNEARAEARMLAILKPFGIVPTFGGDPRGYTVKIKLPSGAYNTWGGSEDGFGVPQRA